MKAFALALAITLATAGVAHGEGWTTPDEPERTERVRIVDGRPVLSCSGGRTYHVLAQDELGYIVYEFADGFYVGRLGETIEAGAVARGWCAIEYERT